MQSNSFLNIQLFKPSLNTLFAFFSGLHFALLQFCYFFMLEAYLSSRAVSFFVALFFWLTGFLLGLNLKLKNGFFLLLCAGVLSYYAALSGNLLFPYNFTMLVVTAGAITISGLAPGYFFVYGKRRFPEIKFLFLHENNGFVTGVAACLFAAVFYGSLLLYLAPLAGLFPLWFFSRSGERKQNGNKKGKTGVNSFILMGLHLGILQVSVYFTIQCFVTATYFAYFAILIAWMAGAIFNMKYALPQKLSTALILSTFAYYLLLVIVSVVKPFTGLYPLLIILVFVLAAPAGAFFREYALKIPAASLFFHENNGFVIGYILSLVAFIKWGVNFLWLGPLLSVSAFCLSKFKSPFPPLLFLASLSFLSFSYGNITASYLLIITTLVSTAVYFIKTVKTSTEASTPFGNKEKLILFIAGINLTTLQFFITREFSSILSASELTILIVAATYFAGFSIGYRASRFLSTGFIRAAAPVIFLLHFIIFLTIKFAAGYYIRVGFNFEVLILLLVTASFLTSSFYSVFLPKLISASGSGNLVYCYSLELSGAILGAGFMFLCTAFFPALLWPLYFSLFLLLVFLLNFESRALPAYISIGFFLIAWLSLHQDKIVKNVTEDYFKTRGYSNPELLFSGNSFYHSIDILDTYKDPARTKRERRVSFINGVRFFSYRFNREGKFDKETSLSEFTYFLAELPAKYLYREKGRKLRVLILGGGSLYSIARVSKYAKSTTLVEIDPLMIETSRKYWNVLNRQSEITNAEIIEDDAKHYLKTTDELFDLIVMDISAPYYLGTMLLHNTSFFKLVKNHLSKGGIFSESTQSRPYPKYYDSTAMKILKGVATLFSEYRVIDARKKPRGKRGFVYASTEHRFSDKNLTAIMKRDDMYRGTKLYSQESTRFNLDRVTPFSLTNMETLLTANAGRFRRRLSIDRHLSPDIFFKRKLSRMKNMEFKTVTYITGTFKTPLVLWGVIFTIAAGFSGYFWRGKTSANSKTA